MIGIKKRKVGFLNVKRIFERKDFYTDHLSDNGVSNKKATEYNEQPRGPVSDYVVDHFNKSIACITKNKKFVTTSHTGTKRLIGFLNPTCMTMYNKLMTKLIKI